MENNIPTGPAKRLMQKGGANPPIFIIIDASKIRGTNDTERIRLKRNPITGIHLTILFESNPRSGIKNAMPSGTEINKTGFK
ncbi:MAG TPA: hypothetical protein VKP78_09745 [bacterium]|nr:hypothetical protein [bacterium]